MSKVASRVQPQHLKCPHCGHANPPGQKNCLNCQKSLQVEIDVTAENVGIELPDGRMAVLIPKNTVYPTSTPILREFYTIATGQRQFEIVVRQGSSEQAAENEYCGTVSLGLPPDLPKGTAITLSFGLDSDGTVTAAAQLRDFHDRPVTTRLLRRKEKEARPAEEGPESVAEHPPVEAAQPSSATAENPCFVSGCAQPSLGHCVQCGRAYCARHGGREAGYGARCRECYEHAVHGFVVAHHLAGKLSDVLAAFDHADPVATPEALYYHGLALAASGSVEAAADRLGRLLPSGDGAVDPAAVTEAMRRAAGTVLSARAVRRMQANDAIGAVEDLQRAAAVLEDNQRQRAILSALIHQSAFAYFKAGRLTDALREWEEAQSRDPQDVQVARYLAIVCYRLASEGEERKAPEADGYWKKAIANWAVVLANPALWSMWAQSRASVVGTIEQNLLDEVQKDTLTRLRTDFSDHRARYLEQKQTADASRHAGYEVELIREHRAAKEMLQAMQRSGTSRQVLRTACGPLMLARWRETGAAADAVEAAQALARANPSLQQYFSPLGTYYVMAYDLKRFDEAQAGLEALIKEKAAAAEAKAMLVEVLLARGRELAEAKAFDRAVPLLEKAASHADKRERVLALLTEAATEHARALLTKDDTVPEAVEMLERIRRAYAVKDVEFTAQLAQAYFRRGVIRSHRNDHKAALDDLRKALEIDPHNEAARQNFAAAAQNYAAELLKKDKYDDALALVSEATTRDPRNANRELLAAIYLGRGIKRANDAVRTHVPYMSFTTRSRLQEALKDLEQANRLQPGNAHTLQQISTLHNLLNKL